MVVEGQRVIRNTAPGVIYSQDHWLRCAVFVPWLDRVKIDRGKDVVIQYARLLGIIRLFIASIPVPVVIADLFCSLFYCMSHQTSPTQVGLREGTGFCGRKGMLLEIIVTG